MTDLLTLDEAAQRVGLRSADGFSRLARRTGIPLVRLSAKVVRVDPRDLEQAIAAHRCCGPRTRGGQRARSNPQNGT